MDKNCWNIWSWIVR